MDRRICRTAISLISYVLDGRQETIYTDIDFSQLFDFSKSHGVENMVYVGLRDLGIEVPEEILKKFRNAYEMSIMLEATQALELDALSDELAKKKISYIPLKGSIIKYMYPMPDYRKSGDIDILVHEADESEASAAIIEAGYSCIEEFEGHDVHTAYKKPPYMQVELHRQLVRQSIRAYDLCKDVWNHVTPDKDYDYRFVMSHEFFYTYMLAHLCKHLYTGGAGIRLITDIWIMDNKMDIDRDKLNDCLKKARLTELYEIIRKLVIKWFGEGYETDADVDMIENIIFDSGSFGSDATGELIRSADKGNKKLKNIWGMIFPKPNSMYAKYPILKKHPCLIGFIWIKRAFEIIAGKHGNIDAAMKKKIGVNSSGVDISNIMNAIR